MYENTYVDFDRITEKDGRLYFYLFINERNMGKNDGSTLAHIELECASFVAAQNEKRWFFKSDEPPRSRRRWRYIDHYAGWWLQDFRYKVDFPQKTYMVPKYGGRKAAVDAVCDYAHMQGIL